jgi:hypothetical protein
MIDETACAEPLPKRDLLLLPLISILTTLLLAGLAEFGSRRIWPEKERDDCGASGRHKPNCVMFMKNIEGPWVRYQTNECGYRGTASCGPKPDGTLRAVILGTSIAFGLHVRDDRFFATLATPELSRIWRHRVEFQNLGDIEPLWLTSDVSLKEMAGLRPDAVFVIIAPFDLNRTDEQLATKKEVKQSLVKPEAGWTWTDVRLALRESRFLYMAQHYMLEDEKLFLRAFEGYADPSDPSRIPTPPLVEQRFERMDARLEAVATFAHSAGAQTFVIALPNRAQAALISKGIQLPKMDAYVFANRMKTMALKHGLNYIDVVPALQKTPNAEKLFYAVDGHPGAGANLLMSNAIVQYFQARGGLCPVKKMVH